jgi:hypothetical protein
MLAMMSEKMVKYSFDVVLMSSKVGYFRRYMIDGQQLYQALGVFVVGNPKQDYCNL